MKLTLCRICPRWIQDFTRRASIKTRKESQVDNYIVEVANGGAIKAYVGITAVVNRRSGESLQ